jgi:dihydrofolate reductase
MGRRTYEYGFKFGIEPGQAAYPHMDHYIFSESAKYSDLHPSVKVVPHDLSIVRGLKAGEGADIYLCGGGIFAGWLLENDLIDTLKIKLSPVIFGDGVRLFEHSTKKVFMELTGQEVHDHGMQIITYRLKN